MLKVPVPAKCFSRKTSGGSVPLEVCTQPMIKKSSFPATFIALLVLVSFGIICVVYLLCNKPLLFLNYLERGLDYHDFFTASERIVKGLSPYNSANNRYVTTPVPAIANLVFVGLGFDGASTLFYILIPLSLLIGYYLLVSRIGFAQEDKQSVLIAGLLVLLFGYPFYFLLQRENIDGWVFLFLCLGFYWLLKPKKECYCGLFFSLAIAFKIYPILIMAPVILGRKWRLFFWTSFWLVLWGIITCVWFFDFQHVVLLRSLSLFRMDENGSLIATVTMILTFMESIGLTAAGALTEFSSLIALLVYGMLLALLVLADYKRGKTNELGFSSFPMYVPFMIAFPQLVYHYSLIICLILVPVVAQLWATHEDGRQRVVILLISFGIAMTQWQAFATFQLTGNVLSQLIPGLGLVVMMSGIVIFKLIPAPAAVYDGLEKA